LIDSPPEIGVVRAHKNWQARLASAALSLQRGHETRILPSEICWTCCCALPPLPHPTEDQNKVSPADDDDDGVMGFLMRLLNEDDSDSEMDDVEVEEGVRSNKRKLYEMENEKEGIPESRHLNLNVVYIL